MGSSARLALDLLEIVQDRLKIARSWRPGMSSVVQAWSHGLGPGVQVDELAAGLAPFLEEAGHSLIFLT